MPSVYLISSDCGLAKVGYSRKPLSRFNALQALYPQRQLTLVQKWTHPMARTIETIAHQRLRGQPVLGREWYSLPVGELAALICRIIGELRRGEVQPSRYLRRKLAMKTLHLPGRTARYSHAEVLLADQSYGPAAASRSLGMTLDGFLKARSRADAAILAAIPLGTMAEARKVGLSKTQFIARRWRLEDHHER